MHAFVQQSAPVVHAVPAEPHAGLSPHEPLWSPPLVIRHASEQH